MNRNRQVEQNIKTRSFFSFLFLILTYSFASRWSNRTKQPNSMFSSQFRQNYFDLTTQIEQRNEIESIFLLFSHFLLNYLNCKNPNQQSSWIWSFFSGFSQSRSHHSNKKNQVERNHEIQSFFFLFFLDLIRSFAS